MELSTCKLNSSIRRILTMEIKIIMKLFKNFTGLINLLWFAKLPGFWIWLLLLLLLLRGISGESSSVWSEKTHESVSRSVVVLIGFFEVKNLLVDLSVVGLRDVRAVVAELVLPLLVLVNVRQQTTGSKYK